MANTHKGEARLEVGNVVYTLVFSVNTICLIEEKLGRGFVRIGLDLQDQDKISYTVVRAMLWGALREKHKEISLEQAGDMIVDGGGFGPVLEKILEAFSAAFPAPEPEDVARPLVPSQIAGTGSGS